MCKSIAFLLIATVLVVQAQTVDVRRYGAKGDGRAKDTRAIQQAIDAVSRDGGEVVIPPGRYLSGTIHLRSNLTVRLSAGAVLVFSPDEADFDEKEVLPFKSVSDDETTYFRYALLAGENVHDVAIVGEGTIDGNRTQRGGPKPIALKVCEHVTIRGIQIRNAPNYAISLLGCDFVNIDGVTITNAFADGIDPDSCRFVRISNCYIDSHDDAICPKASPSLGRARAMEHLTVSNCILRTDASNFKFGTESSGDFRNVTVTNCTMLPREGGGVPTAGISLESVDGAHVKGVVISNIAMDGVRCPVFIRLGNRGRGMNPPRPGSIEDVIISNVTANGATLPSIVAGIPSARVQRVTLSNMHVTSAGGEKIDAGLDVPELEDKYPQAKMFGTPPAHTLYVRHVDGLTVTGLRARWTSPDARSPIVGDDVHDMVIDGVETSTKSTSPVIRLRRAERVIVDRARITDASSAVRIEDEASHDIKVDGRLLTPERPAK